MNETILVNFHCHSIFSDGEQTPEVLAGNLAAAGVRYAALTDHDTHRRLAAFSRSAQKTWRCLSAWRGIDHPVRRARSPPARLWFRPGDIPNWPPPCSPCARCAAWKCTASPVRCARLAAAARMAQTTAPAVSAAPHGRLEIGEAIALIHRAGGRAFWAHPLMFESDLERLDDLIGELKSKGLDGIEAIYAPFSETEQRQSAFTWRKNMTCWSAPEPIFTAAMARAVMLTGSKCPAKTGSSFGRRSFPVPIFTADTSAAEKSASIAQAARVNPAGKRASFSAAFLCPAHFPAHIDCDCAFPGRHLGHYPAFL